MIHAAAEPARYFDDPARLADAIVARVGKTIVLALPLGLGKANHIANALFAKAAADPSIRLTIFTALTWKRRAPRTSSSAAFSIRSHSACSPAIRRSTTRRRSAGNRAAEYRDQ